MRKPGVSLRILIDTNTYSAYKRGSAESLEVIEYSDEIGLPLIVLAELLTGFGKGTRPEQNRQELNEFLQLPDARLVLPDVGTAEVYAHLSNQLRRKGRPIPTNDLWIAALAVQQNYALWTLDEHFRAIEGLKVGSTLPELQG